MIELFLKDTEYEFKETTHIRKTARAVLLNERNEMCILTVSRDDIFGKSTYYETPGGGIDDGELPEVAVIREIDEEIGVKAEVITKLGVINDFYNIIGRNNINNYFLCKIVGKSHIHHESNGDDLITKIEFLPIDEVMKLYESARDSKLGRLLYNREIPILLEAKKHIN